MHFQDCGEPFDALVRPRNLERHACLGQRALGAHDALRDGGLRHQEGARDLVGGKPAQEPQREGDARLRREHRMTCDEHEAKEIVPDVVAQVRIDARLRFLEQLLDLARELVLLLGVQLPLAQPVEGAVLRRRHEPRRRVVRNACRRPRLECGDERVLRELFGETDVAHHPRDAGDDLRRFDSKDGLDRLVGGLGGHAARAALQAAAAEPRRSKTVPLTRGPLRPRRREGASVARTSAPIAHLRWLGRGFIARRSPSSPRRTCPSTCRTSARRTSCRAAS